MIKLLLLFFIISTLFIFLTTLIGSILILFIKKEFVSKKVDAFVSFSGGIMLSAALFSLLIKALYYNDNTNNNLPFVVLGIVCGALMIVLFDVFFLKEKDKKGAKKLFFAMTLHNIPEGLTVGLAFGLAYLSKEDTSYIVPLVLALGIGIQNIPEGTSTSLVLYESNMSKKKSCIYGILSGSVEPISSLIGFLFALYLKDFMPFILSFGAGAMLIVVIEEVIINKTKENTIIKEIMFLLGFLIMMVLDVILG